MLQLEGLTVVPDPRPQRRARLLRALVPSKAEAIVVSHLANVRYLSGFTGSNGVVLLTPKAAILFTDPRYDIQASQECDCQVKVVTGSVWTAVAGEVKRRRAGRVALEAAYVSFDQWASVAALLGRGVKLVAVKDAVEGLRAVKSAGEIEAIRRSVALCSRAYESVVERVRPGMSELEVAAELDHAMRLLGAEGPAFETIVAAGKRSALPHARPTAAKLKSNQILLVDMGASVDGYASDMTRVAHLGRPGARARSLYRAVLEAQLAAIDAVRPGALCREVDAAARNALKRGKLDQFFTHSTGHGLGLEIHEGPRLGTKAETPLEPGMVVTIEPGVYLPEFGGIRIEDTVLVTETGVEILTPTPKEFLVIAS